MRALEALIATQVDEIATRSATQLQQSYALRESELLLLTENAETHTTAAALQSSKKQSLVDQFVGSRSLVQQGSESAYQAAYV